MGVLTGQAVSALPPASAQEVLSLGTPPPCRPEDSGPVPRRAGTLPSAVHKPPVAAPVARPGTGWQAMLGRIRAWMLVLPVDAALLCSPIVWHPQQANHAGIGQGGAAPKKLAHAAAKAGLAKTRHVSKAQQRFEPLAGLHKAHRGCICAL